ncbi:MAG: peptide-methionine (R)-S-oxide reductase [Myxococcales bacterium]
MSDDGVRKSEEQWLAELGAERYRVLRERGTERPFTGELLATKDEGTYLCGACGEALFDSSAKYDSGSGWPSFHSPVEGGAIGEQRDLSHGMIRTEITCARCGSHLGHVFHDGPRPTGLRYCVNSLSLRFRKG